MGRVDPVAEHARTRAALRDAVPRLAELVRSVPDPGAASEVAGWTVGDVTAHLGAVYLAYCSAFTEEFQDWDRVLPPDENAFAARLRAVNASSLTLFGPAERRRLAEFLTEHGETFLEVTRHLAPDAPVPTPWYGEGGQVTVATATGLMLSESLVHGLDIARGAGLRWPLPPDQARLALGQIMPTMMPLALDARRARGVRVAYDVAIRGGPRLAVVIEDGAATVTRDAPPRRYDCRISASPVAFLLVSFGRTPLWRPVLRGQLLATGRRPWLAPRLGTLVASP